ncbi:hypothetical protein GGI13_003278, partial [Coemansia sp. RSA 455]
MLLNGSQLRSIEVESTDRGKHYLACKFLNQRFEVCGDTFPYDNCEPFGLFKLIDRYTGSSSSAKICLPSFLLPSNNSAEERALPVSSIEKSSGVPVVTNTAASAGTHQPTTPHTDAVTDIRVIVKMGADNDKKQVDTTEVSSSQPVALHTVSKQPTSSSADVIGNKRRASPDTGVTSEDPVSSRVGNTTSAAQPSATAGQGSEGLLSQGPAVSTANIFGPPPPPSEAPGPSSPELFGQGPAVSTANIFGQSLPPSEAPGPSSPELFGSAATANTSDMSDEQQLPSAAQGESSTSFFGQGTTTSQNSLIGPPSLPSAAMDRSATDGFSTDDTADPISSMLCQLQLSSIAQGSHVTGGFGTDTTASQNSLFSSTPVTGADPAQTLTGSLSQVPVYGAAPGPGSSSIFSSGTTTNPTSMFGQPQISGAPPSLRTAGGFGQDTIANSGSMFGPAPAHCADTARGSSGGIAANNRSNPTGELGWGAGLRNGHHIEHVTNDVHAPAQTLPPNDFGGEGSADSLVPVFGSSDVSNDNHPGYFVSIADAAHGDSGAAVATRLDGTDNDDLANTNDSSDSDGDSDNEHPNGQDAIDLADPIAPQHDGDTVDDLADMLSQVLRTGASDAAVNEQLRGLMSRLEAPSHHEAPPATNPAAPTSPQDHGKSDSERDSEGEPISLLRRLQTPGIHRWIRERRRHHGDTPLAVRAMFLVMVKTAMRSAQGDAANEELKALSRMSHDEIQRLYAERHRPGPAAYTAIQDGPLDAEHNSGSLGDGGAGAGDGYRSDDEERGYSENEEQYEEEDEDEQGYEDGDVDVEVIAQGR